MTRDLSLARRPDLRAIPTVWTGHMMPPARDLDAALAGLADLAQVDEDDRVFGFLEPRAISWWWDGCNHPSLMLNLNGARFFTIGSHGRSMMWCWTKIAWWDDWYEIGWWPDDNWFALDGGWRRLLWKAINRREIAKLMP